MQALTVTVKSVRYSNEANAFAILSVLPAQSGEVIAAKGYLASLKKGDSVILHGEFQESEKYGKQFHAESYEYASENTRADIEALLGSGVITGVGPKRARDIVEHFGTDTIRILDTEPERLREISGIGESLQKKIVASWIEERAMRNLIMYLAPYGLTISLIYRIYKRYGARSVSIVKENPYQLIETMRGIGFTKADTIAQQVGFALDSEHRLKASLVHIMHETQSLGNCYEIPERLIQKAHELTGQPEALLKHTLQTMLTVGSLMVDSGVIYLPQTLRHEIEVAQLVGFVVTGRAAALMDPHDVKKWAQSVVQAMGNSVNEKQIAAVETINTHGVMILTGGPGTGKTTTLRLIIKLLEESSQEIVLAAPTGRAAKKMGDVTGYPAKTLHRLLEWNSEGYQRNDENLLEGTAFIIDEFSMVDLSMAHAILQAIPKGARVVLVGDADQLPSIGHGNVLSDMLFSNRIPAVILTETFRNAGAIVTAAHQIRNGMCPTLASAPPDNCIFIPARESDQIMRTITTLVTSTLPRKYGIHPFNDIQVLAMMHNGPVGTHEFNRVLQGALNPDPNTTLVYGDVTFAIGDKVMQTHNNYSNQVFNGDVGVITDIIDGELRVEFDGNEVTYTKKDLDQLTLAYCISVHKSQGSEYPAVVIPVTMKNYIMLKRNLIYTAITRAKKVCVLVGTHEAFKLAVSRRDDSRRLTGLVLRIADSTKGKTDER